MSQPKDIEKKSTAESNESPYDKVQSEESHDLKRTLSQDSATTASSEVVTKSFGIRKSELIFAQIEHGWQKAFLFFTIFICMYISLMESSAVRQFTSYATNSYKQHSLMSTIGVIRSVVAAASLPFYARMSDTFGRIEMFLVGMVFRIVGLIIQSQATDINKYAAGVVLYGFGVAGMRILWQINLQDASSLRWRLAAIGVLSLTTIITTWSSGEVNTALLDNRSWSFGIAMWAFTTPLVCVPYMGMYLFLYLKAIRTDAWKKLKSDEKEAFIAKHADAKRYHDEVLASPTASGRYLGYTKYLGVRTKQVLIDTFWRVDFIGCILIALVFGLILVPLTLAGGTSHKWERASTIVPIVLGFVVCIPLFVIWEKKITKTPMLPFKVMRDRGIWAGFLVGVFSTLITSMPNDYSYPVLLVGMNASTTVATRTGLLSSFVEGIAMPILGFVLSRVRRTKGFILFGDAVMFIAMGLFVHFRGDSNGTRAKYFRDGVAIAYCIEGFATIFFTRVASVSVQACTNHEYMATVTAIFAATYQIGSAIGSSVSGAIWTQQMYQVIYDKMEELGVDTSLAKLAYQSPYNFIKEHAWGTPGRRAVSMAYADIQRKLSITGLCLCVPMLIWIMFLRDHRLSDAQNLDDESVLEKGGVEKVAERSKSRMLFTEDKDYILDFLKKLVGRK